MQKSMETFLEYKGIRASIVLNSMSMSGKEDDKNYKDWFCGYIRMEQGTDIDVDFIPVHGGITYDEVREDGYRWIGFDCLHFGDDMLNCSFLYVQDEIIKLIDYYLEERSRVFNDEEKAN